MSLIRKFVTVASGTLVSRIFGFAREMLMAAALGTGPVADTFNAAFRFPNTFRRLFAEGAFNAAFVPLFAKEIESNGMEGAKRFSEEIFSVLFTVLLCLTIASELSMPLLVRFIIAPGFVDNTGKFANTVILASIMFPYLSCMSLAAMMSGMLNSLHRYFAAAIAPVFLNLFLIGVLGYAWYKGHDPISIGYNLSWGVLAAGVVQLAIVWIAIRNAGIVISFRLPSFSTNVKRLLILAFPAAIIGGITQINSLINTNIASGQEGAISSLAFADRIYQLPLGVVGIAVATVLLPELVRTLRSGHLKEAVNLQNRSVELTLLLTLPAAAALLVIATPIVQLLYEHGKFSTQSTQDVANILSIYGLGLPAYVLIKAFIPSFFAREDTRTPMYFAALSLVVNLSCALTFFPIFGANGIAMAEIMAGWINAILLFVTLVRRNQWSKDKAIWSRIVRLIIASVIMAVGLHYALPWLSSPLDYNASFIMRTVTLCGLIVIAMVIYFALAFGLGGTEMSMIQYNLKRKSHNAETSLSPPHDSA